MNGKLENNDIIERFEDGINKFNKRKFYECHDVLEDVWFEIRGSSRGFYQGLIHLAVGFYLLTHRKNLNGALSQLNKGIDKLSNFSPEFKGIEIKNLLKKVTDCVKNIQELKDVNKFDVKKIPKIKFVKDKFRRESD